MSFKAIHNSAFGFYAKREFRPYLKAEAFNNSEWGKHRTPAIDKLIDFSIIMSNNATLVSAKLVDWCKGYAGEETSLSLSLFDINTLNSSNKQVTLNYSGTTLLDSTVYELVLEDSDSNIVYSDFFAAYEVGSTDLPVNAPSAEPSTISGGCIAGEELINSANDLAPNFAANRYIKLTDTAEQLQRINITGLTDSPTFTVFFKIGSTIAHNTTTSANLYGIYLSTEQNHEFTRPTVIHFQLDRSDNIIREIGRATVVDEILLNEIFIEFGTAACKTVDSTSFIDLNFNLTGTELVDNAGSAGVELDFVNNKILFNSTGTAYNIRVLTGSGAPLHIYPLAENPRLVSNGTYYPNELVFDVVGGNKSYIFNVTGLDTQEDYFYNHEFGSQLITSSNGLYEMNVPIQINGNKFY